ncbi:general transcription factor II-I repeat domain-containing protein 2-like [Belonocnema kinseyi]|uniref:general transcription factor II-I repeat domain-containing protein 2-like n=1 Tax=Belonocnema kinseyi TaxID=2817044 RepID=UPI00143DC40F|nr:general transcription factor II-I repeat domain-containing protein 2-like [Belonocnema kinseyi]
MECNSSSSNLSLVFEDSTKAGIPEKPLKKTEERERTYSFSNEWESEIFQIRIDKEPCYCLLCGKRISMNQKRNLKRHFDTCQADVDHSHPLGSALRAEKLQQLKAEYSQRCGKVKNEDIVSTNPHDSSRWFPDEDNRRDFVNIVQNTHLSPATVTRRVNAMADNVHEQLNIDLKKCVCFSIKLDESIDKSDTAQLVVMIRFVLENGSV